MPMQRMYQEWPTHGVFKPVIIRDDVRYGIESSLEEPHALICPQHRVTHKPTDRRDFQPRDI